MAAGWVGRAGGVSRAVSVTWHRKLRDLRVDVAHKEIEFFRVGLDNKFKTKQTPISSDPIS